MRSGIPLFIGVAVLLGAGAGRLAYLEASSGRQLRENANAQQRASIKLTAQRGEILDSRGRVLAGSILVPSIYVDVTRVGDPRFAAYSVGPILGLDPLELEKLLIDRASDGFVWIKRGIGADELESFKAVRQARRLNGFAIQYEPVRVYPNGPIAPHVIGFVGADQHGLAGVEQAWERVLAGTPGERSALVDVRRRRLASDEYTPPRDGASVVLTIDTYIQQMTERRLQEAVDKFGAEWGTAVVMDPQSGEILAMATVPDFDPAQPIPPGLAGEALARAQERLRNRGISDSYEPGSIFKPFVMACALDEKITTLDRVFAINGPVRRFGARTINDTHPYGALTAHEIISKSSNIGMGMIGDLCRNERLYRYMRLYGFGDPTGISLPGEHPGQLNDFSRWTSFSTQSIPIGQEVAVTPIQVVTAFSSFCNGGVLMKPRIVRGVIGSDGRTLEDHSQPVPVRNVLAPETAQRFRLEALVETVISGTGKSAKTLHWQVFGKTGTAQIANPGGRGYQQGKYTASFVGGAPAANPRVVAVVSVYKPTKGGSYYGGVVAAPTVGAILGDTLEHLQVPHELKDGAVRELPTGADGRD